MARRMLRGSKAVSRLLQQGGLVKRISRRAAGRRHTQGGRRPRPREEAPEGPAAPEDSAQPVAAAPSGPADEDGDYWPSSADEGDGPPVPAAHEVAVPMDDDLESEPEAVQAIRQEWAQLDRQTKRQRLLDDVPHFMKRKFVESEPILPAKRQRVNAAWIVQALAATAGEGPANEWVSRHELEVLRKLTGLPLSAVRVHRSPRKKLMRPPKLVSRSRLSILIGQDPSDRRLRG